MKLTRSILSLALALVLVFSLGAGVFAAEWPQNDFTDVPRSEWYAEAVDFAEASGLMNGVGDHRFDPQGSVTRAMVVTVLYRMEEEPDVTGKTCPFSDVPVGSWFFNAVIWAADQGVTTGKTETAFAPNESITREQMAAMIIRYALASSGDKDVIEDAMKMDPDGKLVLKMLSEGVPAELAKGFPAVEGFKGFSDADSISPYARWYVLFCRLTGIMNGDAAGTFRPQSTLTRAECAKTFMNLYELGEEFLSAA